MWKNGRVYIKLITCLFLDRRILISLFSSFFFQWACISFTVRERGMRMCVKRACGDESKTGASTFTGSVLDGARGSAWNPKTKNDHLGCSPGAPLSPSLPSSALFPFPPPMFLPSPWPADPWEGYLFHPRQSWAWPECAIDPRRGRRRRREEQWGFHSGFPLSVPRAVELSQAWGTRTHTFSCSDGLGRWLCLAPRDTQIGNSYGENLRSSVLAAD